MTPTSAKCSIRCTTFISFTLMGMLAPVAHADSATIEPYYYFVHWVSTGYMDRALEQFAPTAVVIAGRNCSRARPCVGSSDIRDRYLPALSSGEMPLPLADLQFDDSTLRTHGDTLRAPSALDVARRTTGSHLIQLRDHKIARLEFAPAASVGSASPSTEVAAATDSAQAPVTLYHRFTLSRSSEWIDIALKPQSLPWRLNAAEGPLADAGQIRAVLSSLQGMAIGTRCTGQTEGPTHYPCSLELDVRDGRARGEGLDDWVATTGHALIRPSHGLVSALSAPPQYGAPFPVGSERSLVGLVAPPAFRAQLAEAEGKPLRLRLRVTHSPAASPSPGDAREVIVIVLSSQPFGAQPAVQLPATKHRI